MTTQLSIKPENLPGFRSPTSDSFVRPTLGETNTDNVRYAQFASPPPRTSTLARIAELHEYAVEEGIGVSAASESDLHMLLVGWPAASDPCIFLLDNGNFRAVWSSVDGRQIGMQFLGGKYVQFVLFARGEGCAEPVPVAGRDTIDRVKRQILRSNLMGLLYQ